MNIDKLMYQWVVDLFPICRSITGEGVRQTLSYLQDLAPDIQINEIKSGEQAFDWTVPDEWTIREAYITDEAGNKIIDFKNNNLHLVSYSTPIDKWFSKEELEPHLHSLPDQPDAIPYVTSYYSKNWGFCLSHKQKKSLSTGNYHVVVDSDLKPGVLNYGELVLPGLTDKEILLSTYICHPSMANNELSGPVVTTAIAKWLSNLENRYYTYRIIYVPETIGSIVYLSKNAKKLKEKVIAGFNVTCVGDDRTFSFLPSRKGNTLADRVAEHVLKQSVKKFDKYSFLDRGSDERQYCSPGIDLPVCSVMRSKYGTYPEYHTSLDDLNLVSPKGLYGAYEILTKIIETIECNKKYTTVFPCEPQLGKRGLYPNLGAKKHSKELADMMNILAYSDGSLDLVELAETVGKDALYVHSILVKLQQSGLVDIVES